jgi:hypothetical protein
MKNKEYTILFIISFVAFYAVLSILAPINLSGGGGTATIGGVDGTQTDTCTGSIKLSFFPEQIETGTRMSAIISGLENCNGKVVFVRQQINNDLQLQCSCVVATGNGCGCSFAVPTNSCLYSQYYAQVDMNGNGNYNDVGETDVATATISNCPLV